MVVAWFTDRPAENHPLRKRAAKRRRGNGWLSFSRELYKRECAKGRRCGRARGSLSELLRAALAAGRQTPARIERSREGIGPDLIETRAEAVGAEEALQLGFLR